MPLTIFAVPGESLTIKLASDRHRYDEETLASLLERLRTLLINLTKDARRAVGSVPLVSAEEAAQLLASSPETPVADKAVHEPFETHATLRPDADAVMLGGQTMTYGDLNARANRLARHLRSIGVGAGDFVALAVDRTFDMTVGMLGILKSGAAYVPEDPAFPPARAAFMIDCANVSVIVSTESHAEATWAGGRLRVSLDGDGDAIARQDSTNLSTRSIRTIAYAMFTPDRPACRRARHARGASNFLLTIPCRGDIAPAIVRR